MKHITPDFFFSDISFSVIEIVWGILIDLYTFYLFEYHEKYEIKLQIIIIHHIWFHTMIFLTQSKSPLTFNREKDWKEVGNPLVTLFFFNLLYPRTTHWNTSCGEFCMIRHIKDAHHPRETFRSNKTKVSNKKDSDK